MMREIRFMEDDETKQRGGIIVKPEWRMKVRWRGKLILELNSSSEILLFFIFFISTKEVKFNTNIVPIKSLIIF